ncbi:MAG: hypothetical protein E7Z85_08940 [Methanosphaera stadtmanae]|uniref:Uncharacterized protein n=1 Tax=Methanobrevibacter olleyae TaxID=294671 RepID=A0A8T3VZJ8_METOL|nr:hypothetical protein [Methanosphaera stadtmanae]MBE6513445.1 hypothetical protein [Methanobrevibacter olleyae]
MFKLSTNNDVNNNIEEIIKNLENLPDISECEYIYLDTLNIPKNTSFLKNKIIITQNNLQDFLMFEYDNIDNTNQIKDITELNFRQMVDLVILLDSENIPKNITDIIDKDTIVSKNLGNNIIYIEDLRKNQYTIISKYEKIVIEGRATETHIKFYENNT